MQTKLTKIFLFFVFFLLFLSSKAEVPDYKEVLDRADSLFEQELYIEAGRLYEEVYVQGELYSPQMLLHLAYIKEASGQLPQALYYLNLYYKLNPSVKVLEKIDKIAKAQGFEGYTYTDAAYFDHLLRRYHTYLWAVPFVIGLFWFLLLFWQRQQLSLRRIIAFSAFVLLTGFFYNWRSLPKAYVILHQSPAVLMSAPSAASEKLFFIEKAGHRFELLGQTDIWYKVRWREKQVYLRRHNALVLEL
jgi:hypothetical protein